MSELSPPASFPAGILTDDQLLGLGAAHGRHSVSMLPYARAVELATTENVLAQFRAVIESVAQEWDGCFHDDIGGEVDIGQAIRLSAGRKLAAQLQVAAASAPVTAVEAASPPAATSSAQCPFCGSLEAKVVDFAESAIHVKCRCGAELWGGKAHFGSADQAMAAWGRRAPV